MYKVVVKVSLARGKGKTRECQTQELVVAFNDRYEYDVIAGNCFADVWCDILPAVRAKTKRKEGEPMWTIIGMPETVRKAEGNTAVDVDLCGADQHLFVA
ncbi:hypothetical protein ml_251 [Mollivirus sibericum]|uniref:hypothetical protein n=1 Tax=Mollivirus sibericum TaxID=1678078 RepID=UPI0006B2DCE1|nr:hypothetical protein ml_251 [Mollivirus sibericum]ALD62053.1 hypothetical protein ml_251 [Mollivirus sibericum]